MKSPVPGHQVPILSVSIFVKVLIWYVVKNKFECHIRNYIPDDITRIAVE